MKKIYIAAAILIAFALTESCIKQRITERSSSKEGQRLIKWVK